jgi:hypothetical protein
MLKIKIVLILLLSNSLAVVAQTPISLDNIGLSRFEENEIQVLTPMDMEVLSDCLTQLENNSVSEKCYKFLIFPPLSSPLSVWTYKTGATNKFDDFENLIDIGAQYEIVNTSGIVIANGILQQAATDIDASSWSNGLHFVRILTKDFQPVTIKIVVQKL